jgi:hypothetical protein
LFFVDECSSWAGDLADIVNFIFVFCSVTAERLAFGSFEKVAYFAFLTLDIIWPCAVETLSRTSFAGP